MNPKNDYLEYILELLEPFGNITYKAMFGGYGIYKSGLIFAIIADGEVYFKGDKEEADEFYQGQNSNKFGYDAKGKIITMSYWKVPADVLEDEELLAKWFEFAYNSALKSKKNKK